RAGQRAVADQLERDQTLGAGLPGLVDDAHTAATQLLEDFVTGDRRPSRRLRPRRGGPVAGRRALGHRVFSSGRWRQTTVIKVWGNLPPSVGRFAPAYKGSSSPRIKGLDRPRRFFRGNQGAGCAGRRRTVV